MLEPFVDEQLVTAQPNLSLSPHASRIRGNEPNCTGNCNPRFIHYSIFPQNLSFPASLSEIGKAASRIH